MWYKVLTTNSDLTMQEEQTLLLCRTPTWSDKIWQQPGRIRASHIGAPATKLPLRLSSAQSWSKRLGRSSEPASSLDAPWLSPSSVPGWSMICRGRLLRQTLASSSLVHLVLAKGWRMPSLSSASALHMKEAGRIKVWRSDWLGYPNLNNRLIPTVVQATSAKRVLPVRKIDESD